MKPQFAVPVFLLLAFSSVLGYSQQVVTGRVSNIRNEPLTNATVLLLKSNDSSVVKATIADKQGQYHFATVLTGNYFISVSLVGHDTAWSSPFKLGVGDSLNVPPIIMKEGIVLNEVVVKGRKPLFQLKPDRVVMNVSASPAFTGNTALEVLQKTPGILVDRQANSIAMNSKGQVLIMINNKIQRVPIAVLVARLEGMRAENIEQIELIHQPPAKYDASGAAGIIHIVLKETNDEGTNANLSLNAGYGQREKAGTSINVNSRKHNINIYGGYNFNLDKTNKYTVNHFREYDYLTNIYYHENYVTLANYSNISHAGNIGVDIDFGKKTVLGALFTGTKSSLIWAKDGLSKSDDYINNARSGQQNFYLNPTTDIASISANVNVSHNINPKSNLNFNMDYAAIRYDNATDLKSNSDSTAVANRRSNLDFWIISIDNTNELRKDTKLEVGIKGSFNKTTSITSSRNFHIAPELFSGVDNINERILAAYASLTKKFSKKLSGELGVRYEHYTYTLDSEKGDDLAKAFKNPFPIVRFHYNIDSTNSLQIAFNRAISRPPFFNLTSFLIILDSSLTVYANPRLRPSFTNTLKISYGHRSLILSLAYLWRKGEVYFYNTVDKTKHLQTSVPVNLDIENMIEANLSFPVSVAKWWKMNWNLNGLYHVVKDETNHPVKFQNSIFTGTVQLNNSFRLGTGWTSSIDGRYRSWYLVGDQEQLLHPYLNVGIKKEFSSGSTFGVVLQDLTNSSGKKTWRYHQAEIGIRTFGNNNFSERQVRVTYTHLFGNKALSGKRERKTGSEEVKSRM